MNDILDHLFYKKKLGASTVSIRAFQVRFLHILHTPITPTLRNEQHDMTPSPFPWKLYGVEPLKIFEAGSWPGCEKQISTS